MSKPLCAALLAMAAVAPWFARAAESPVVAQTSAAALLPPSVVLYVETAATADLLEAVFDHPLRPKVEALPQLQAWRQSNKYDEFIEGVRFVESQLGVGWRQAVEQLGAGGIVVAFDGASQGVAMLAQTEDPALLAKGKAAFLRIARGEAEQRGRSDPVKSASYRGVQAYRLGDLRFAIVDKWLILTSSSALGKDIVDRALDGDGGSLLEHERFQEARATAIGSPSAWAYADLETIRRADVAPELFRGQADDPGAELLAGGLLNTLHRTPFATAHLEVRQRRLALRVAMPCDPSWTPPAREFFFGRQNRGAAPSELRLDGTVLEIGAHRGVSEMWLHGPDLFDDKTNADLARSDSELSTVFGGRPFAEEILGALDRRLRVLVVREPTEQAAGPSAAPKLPGFALVGRLKDPQESQRPLRIAFQTIIGFANLDAGQSGMPPLELENHRGDGKILLTASYHPDDLAAEGDEQAMMAGSSQLLLGLSPTIAFADDAVVVASTRSLATRVLDRLTSNSGSQQTADRPGRNTALRLNSESLQALIADNREILIAQNMLEKGHGRGAARAEIEGLQTLLTFFDEAAASMDASEGRLEISVQLFPSEE